MTLDAARNIDRDRLAAVCHRYGIAEAVRLRFRRPRCGG